MAGMKAAAACFGRFPNVASSTMDGPNNNDNDDNDDNDDSEQQRQSQSQ